jgi:chemotaxis protein MotA
MRKNLDITTIVGLVLGLVGVFGSYYFEGGKLAGIILGPAMMIVFVGTFAAAMIGTSLSSFLNIGKLLRIVVFPPAYSVEKEIQTIVRFSTIARRDGLLALEKELGSVSNAFMRKILRFAIDGTEPEVLRGLAETEVRYVNERHADGAMLFQKMGGYSPTMGIIGTVMGLIATLSEAGNDPDILIHHIGSAFVATLWGVLMANLVWLPIADKLRHIHNEEYLFMDLIVEGILAIQAGEIPSVIKAKLYSMLPIDQQAPDTR